MSEDRVIRARKEQNEKGKNQLLDQALNFFLHDDEEENPEIKQKPEEDSDGDVMEKLLHDLYSVDQKYDEDKEDDKDLFSPTESFFRAVEIKENDEEELKRKEIFNKSIQSRQFKSTPLKHHKITITNYSPESPPPPPLPTQGFRPQFSSPVQNSNIEDSQDEELLNSPAPPDLPPEPNADLMQKFVLHKEKQLFAYLDRRRKIFLEDVINSSFPEEDSGEDSEEESVKRRKNVKTQKKNVKFLANEPKIMKKQAEKSRNSEDSEKNESSSSENEQKFDNSDSDDQKIIKKVEKLEQIQKKEQNSDFKNEQNIKSSDSENEQNTKNSESENEQKIKNSDSENEQNIENSDSENEEKVQNFINSEEDEPIQDNHHD